MQAVFVDRGVDDAAAELLEEAGVLVVARVPHKELVDLAEHCGAKLLKRSSLSKPGRRVAETVRHSHAYSRK